MRHASYTDSVRRPVVSYWMGAVLFAVGAVCGYLTAVIGRLIYWPQDCTVSTTSSCGGLADAWPTGIAGAVIGGLAYTVLGLAAGLPGRRPSAHLADTPSGAERATAALAHLTLYAGLPLIGPAIAGLVAGRTAQFLRRHAIAAARLQLWQALLIFPTVFFFWPTLGLYLLVTLTALIGGLVYALLGAIRAGSGRLPAYPANRPPCPDPAPQQLDSPRRERRAKLALVVLVGLIAANLLRVTLTD